MSSESSKNKPLIFSLSRNKRNNDILVKILGEQGYEVAGCTDPVGMVSDAKNREKVNWSSWIYLVLIRIYGNLVKTCDFWISHSWFSAHNNTELLKNKV